MQPEHTPNPRRRDSATQKVMEVGISRYFAPVESGVVAVEAQSKLKEAANRLEEFLQGEGRGSQFSDYFNDLDVAGLRSCAKWVPAGTLLSVADFDELFGIATSGNVAPLRGQSEAGVFEEFRRKVETFVEIHGFEKGV